jgi:phage terminase large subunit-like protein
MSVRDLAEAEWSPFRRVASRGRAFAAEYLRGLSKSTVLELPYMWRGWLARPRQLAPPGKWFVWIIQAGRGSGKTRTAAEWVREKVENGEASQVALVNDTVGDTLRVMIRNPKSGLENIGPPARRPKYFETARELRWPHGVAKFGPGRVSVAEAPKAYTYSAEAPELLRGPEHDLAWADELAKWKNLRKKDREGGTAWDNLLFGLRLGTPQACVSTTPRNVDVFKALVKEHEDWLVAHGGTRIGTRVHGGDPTGCRIQRTLGSTHDNRENLAPEFYDGVVSKYEGTRLGRQELEADLLSDTPGAAWQHDLIDRYRVEFPDIPEMRRIVVAVDPSATKLGNQVGIVGAGLGVDGHGYTFEDATDNYSPAEWSVATLQLYDSLDADVVVIETNQGGEMCAHTIRMACRPCEQWPEGRQVPRILEVHAARGKIIRAEPIATIAEQGRWHMVGVFPELEDELCSYVPGMPSPNRMDAHVYTGHALFPSHATGSSFKNLQKIQKAMPGRVVDQSTLDAFG